MQRSLAILLVASIDNIEKADELPLFEIVHIVQQGKAFDTLLDWDGKSPIELDEGMWFELLATLMLGEPGLDVNFSETSLIGSRGWSVFVNTFGIEDPASLGK